ncbi:hypothetical protein Thimo_1194 [Thioflavicoccus mobilis 8321]|uniref:YecA family protein n=1 Tax=Thioflavicoccus mobilis 8321 TaxID=765912 RepID=L0GVZ9_9GAMM|nr:UPF0149 family protein [Thioflavicoccus mobilis]AGA89992.1 hypothetical protein Thimo_1194 [Thioflavicoccus mobilis 8321]
MEATTDTDYRQLAQQLEEVSLSPAEVHGILWGLLCSGTPEMSKAWLGELAHGQDGASSVQAALTAIVEQTRAGLAGHELALTLLLPDEEWPLVERAEAVYDWCRGLLYGLGLARIDAADLSPAAREVFDDFMTITRLDLETLEADEENEQALTEITEFTRVAALLLYEECAGGDG